MTKPLVRDTKKIIGLAARERLGVVRVEHAPSIEKPYVGPAVKDFTAWKFKLLDTAAANSLITDSQFRFFFTVFKHANYMTRMAIASDKVLTDEVPGCRNKKTCQRHRKHLVDLGYWRVEPGHGSRGTRYYFLSALTSITRVRDDLNDAIDRRKKERGLQARHSKHSKNPSREGAGESPQKGSPGAGSRVPKVRVLESPPSGTAEPPVQLFGTSSLKGPSLEDLSGGDTRTPVREWGPIPIPRDLKRLWKCLTCGEPVPDGELKCVGFCEPPL